MERSLYRAALERRKFHAFLHGLAAACALII